MIIGEIDKDYYLIMSYPLVIKDNFFPDPDAIVKLSKKIVYCVNQKIYPGLRSQCLSEVNNKLYLYIGSKIFSLLHDKFPTYYSMKIAFHKTSPIVKGDKWDKKNLGWVHKDACLFGGVIYMDKNPDKDAGTGIYKSKYGYDVQTRESMDCKEKLFSGEQIDDIEYYNAYDIVHDQYEETLRIPNVYNRLVLIPGDQPHAMTTIGDKERNTIVFFCTDAMGVYPPEYKNSFISIPNHAF